MPRGFLSGGAGPAVGSCPVGSCPAGSSLAGSFELLSLPDCPSKPADPTSADHVADAEEARGANAPLASRVSGEASGEASGASSRGGSSDRSVVGDASGVWAAMLPDSRPSSVQASEQASDVALDEQASDTTLDAFSEGDGPFSSGPDGKVSDGNVSGALQDELLRLTTEAALEALGDGGHLKRLLAGLKQQVSGACQGRCTKCATPSALHQVRCTKCASRAARASRSSMTGSSREEAAAWRFGVSCSLVFCRALRVVS